MASHSTDAVLALPMLAPASAARPDDVDDDAACMLAFAAGDAGAFDRLYARHRGPVYRYLLRHVASHRATADELFQDVWMSVVRASASYVPSARFTTWLYRIAHNRIVDHWRSTGALPAFEHDDEGELVAAIPGTRTDEPEVRASAAELRTRLHAALAALPPAQRDAFLLHQEGGLELSEIAALTGVGVETVKSRVRYATQRLRAALEDMR
jgi:RNA polymerase sigma-70 factor (ECF subfamily)